MTPAGHKATATAIVEQIAKRREVQHTREVVREGFPDAAKAVILKLTTELDATNKRLEQLESALLDLARRALQ